MRTPLLLLPLLLFTAPLPAAGPNQAIPLVFSVHDQDRDGYLSQEEYAALRSQCQARGHESGNRGGRPRCALLDFATLDADHDGRIGEDELVEALGRRFHGGGSGGGGRGRPINTQAPAGNP